jgi:hypothetical protein
MASIAIKDLPDSVELDRLAMAAIVGGARSGARYGSLLQAAANLSTRFPIRASTRSGRHYKIRRATRIIIGPLAHFLSSGLMNGRPDARISAATAHHVRHRIVDILVAWLRLQL